MRETLPPIISQTSQEEIDLFSIYEMGCEKIIHLINNNEFNKIPKHLITKDILLRPTNNGQNTPLLSIIASGQLDLIPKELITKDILLHGFPNCGLFETIKKGEFGLIVDIVLANPKLLDVGDDLENTIFHSLVENGQLGILKAKNGALITNERLTKTNKDGWNAIHRWANMAKTSKKEISENDYLNQIPREFLTKENLTRRTRSGLTPLHSLAINGLLSKLKEIAPLGQPPAIDKESVWIKNIHDMTVAHCAARFGGLKDIVDIDPNILSQGLLECPDNDRNTPLHYAAEAGFLNQIPEHQITESNLLLRNRNGNTVILNAAFNGNINQIPKEFMTPKNLLDTNIYGESAFDLARISATLGSLLEYIPTKVLNHCRKSFALSDKKLAKNIEDELKFRVKKNLQIENLENQESMV